MPDDENPEWTEEEIRTAKPFAEVFPEVAAAMHRGREQRDFDTIALRVLVDLDTLEDAQRTAVIPAAHSRRAMAIVATYLHQVWAAGGGRSDSARVERVVVTDDRIMAHFRDGRLVSVPLAWSRRLAEATPAQRARYQLIGDGQGVHWPELDEDLSVDGFFRGAPARR